MKLKINGEDFESQDQMTITELLKNKGVETPDMVSVELNEEIIPSDNFDSIKLAENDQLEFLYFMGGG